MAGQIVARRGKSKPRPSWNEFAHALTARDGRIGLNRSRTNPQPVHATPKCRHPSTGESAGLRHIDTKAWPNAATFGSKAGRRIMAMLAVFDLDGTLLDGDSTALWLWERVRRSPLRALAALAVFPIAAPMVALPRTRRAGASILLWIATVGLCELALRELCALFGQRFRRGDSALAWRAGGMAALTEHLRAGDRVVVVTAASALLAQVLIEPLGHPIDILATSLKPRAGGWVADIHCRNQRKCQALAEAGHGARWAYAYTDSLDDLPLLRGAERPVIVKGGKAAERRLFRAGLTQARAAVW
jgi:phosphatidylglycerophosphatase C